MQQAKAVGIDPQTKLVLLQKAQQKDSKFVEVYWEAAKVWISRDSLEKAIEVLRSADNEGMPQRTNTQILIAETLMMKSDFSQAKSVLDNIEGNEYEKLRKVISKKCESALALTQNPVPFNPINLTAVNTEMDDYFPSITADGSTISTTVADRRLRGHAQEDLYWSTLKDSVWQKSKPLKALNTDGNEGSQSFSADGRYMFYVACDRKESDGGCDIYYSIRNGDSWSLPINPGQPLNTTYWESNPVLSPAGNELFYVTNRDGQSDIWHCDVVIGENGLLTFKNPRSLGKPVNTNSDEYAPFIHADNKTLYFASKGHDGLGQNDIFFSVRENGKWSKPQNLGYPINTESDESNLIVSADGHTAIFSSDKLQGFGRQDLYQFDLPVESRAQEVLYQEQLVDEEQLQIGASITLQNVFFQSGKYALYESSLVELDRVVDLLTSNPAMRIELAGHTDNVGSSEANQLLSEQRAKAVYDYLVSRGIPADRLEYKGYGETRPIADNDTQEGRAQNRRTVFTILSK